MHSPGEKQSQHLPQGNERHLAVVVNPHSGGGAGGNAWQVGAELLRRRDVRLDILETIGDGDDFSRIRNLVVTVRPSTVLAAGGDGTVRDVVEALLSLPSRPLPALALFPIGTANDVARSLGLLSCRAAKVDTVELAVATALEGRVCRIDVGEVSSDGGSDQHFVGSFAVGMDADILITRNRWSRWSPISGYPLYLLSCAMNLLRSHGAQARLCVDGVERALSLYQVLITNTPLYAGEFRFDGDNTANDGHLDLLPVSGALEYVRAYVAAWRRHVHHTRGEPVVAAPQLQRVSEVTIEMNAGVAGQLDGEQIGPGRQWKVRVLPNALGVCLPFPHPG